MSELTRNDRTVRKKFKEYFWLTVVTAMGSSLAMIIDQIIVGNMLGSSALATINLLTPLLQVYFALSCMIGIGTVTMISVAKGKGDAREADRMYSVGLVIVLALSALLMLAQLLGLDVLVELLSPDPTLRTLARQYYLPNLLGTPLYFLLSYYSYIVRIDGRPKLSLIAMLGSSVIDSALSALFLAVFPGLGIMGASIGTQIGRLVGCVLLATHYLRRKNSIRLCLGGEGIRAKLKRVRLIAQNGISSTLGDLLYFIRLAFLNSVLQVLDVDPGIALVALSVSTSCQILITAFIVGASDTTVPLVGVLMGQKDYEGVKMTLRYALRTLLLSSLAVIALLEAFPAVIAGVFGISSPAELAHVVPAIRICALGFAAMSVTELLLYYHTAIGKTGLSILASIVKSVVFIIPFTLLLCKPFGIKGAWWAFVASACATLLVTVIAVEICKRRSKGKYADFYLLEDREVSEKLYFSISSEPKSLSEGIAALQHFMEEKDVPAAIAYKIAMAIDETANSARSVKDEVDMDVRICYMPEVGEITISVRDNGGERMPFPQAEPETLEDRLTEVGVLRALAKRIEHTTVLGFNQTTLTIGVAARR